MRSLHFIILSNKSRFFKSIYQFITFRVENWYLIQAFRILLLHVLIQSSPYIIIYVPTNLYKWCSLIWQSRSKNDQSGKKIRISYLILFTISFHEVKFVINGINITNDACLKRMKLNQTQTQKTLKNLYEKETDAGKFIT